MALICAVSMAGCGSGGLLNLNPQPNGNIVITNATTGATLQTTLAKPFLVPGGAFSIGITEDHFSGPYTISISTWTAPFSMSCFVPHYIDQTDKTNVVSFTADNASPVTAPTQPSPCNPFVGTNGATQTDEETAQITDGKGHTATFYYQIAGATPGSVSTPTAAAKLAVSWSGPSPTAAACGAYVLNVSAVSAKGTAVPTSAANAITLSTTGGGYMGFSTATSGAAGFTCTGSPPVGSPGGTASLQLTSSPTQVLVYFNGFNAAASTTITASSVGLPPVILAITTTTSTTPATNLAVSWSGPSPTGSECGAYVLNVGAVNASGTTVPTTAANPITLSTTGGGYMGFADATAGAGFTCTGTPPVGSPGGTATFSLSASPAQVLVYFNGFNAAASTTITANSVGVPPVTLAIANAATTMVASIKLAWNGQVPTPANCGAFILNVQAFDASGKQIVSSLYGNPITVSTNSAIWSGFSTVVAGISPAPAPAALTCGDLTTTPVTLPTVGTPTLAVPDTATPTVVYYAGPFSGGARTTITATAPGVPALGDGTISF